MPQFTKQYSSKNYRALLPEETVVDETLATQVYFNNSLAHDEQRMAELNCHYN